MPDNSLFDLDQKLQILAQTFLSQVNAAIVPSTCKITTTWRSPEAQATAYADGLSNAKPGQSPHECCLPDGSPASKAFDYSVYNPDGSYVTDGTDERYTTGGQIAKGIGLAWGGDWNHPDFDHCELVNWNGQQ